MMGHVALLGDSILDNGAYVSGGSPVVEQLRGRLPRGWRTTLLARDGADSSGVIDQVERLPEDVSHLVISAGGNDALESAPILTFPNPDLVQLLEELVSMQNEFRLSYRRMIRTVVEKEIPTLACTIYDAIPSLGPAERMALSLFNDVIVRELCTARFPVLDLRLICDEASDYAEVSPIEPSEIGGSKIASAIARVVMSHDFSTAQTVVYP